MRVFRIFGGKHSAAPHVVYVTKAREKDQVYAPWSPFWLVFPAELLISHTTKAQLRRGKTNAKSTETKAGKKLKVGTKRRPQKPQNEWDQQIMSGDEGDGKS